MQKNKLRLPKVSISPIAISVFFALNMLNLPAQAADDNVEFNTDILDLQDSKNIDLSRFSRSGYILPGSYTMDIMLNGEKITNSTITFLPPPNDPKSSVPCLSPELVKLLGFTDSFSHKLTWWNDNQCLDIKSAKGMEAKGALGDTSLHISIPQAYLEYSTPDWDPPSRWDNGVPAAIFDYNLNFNRNWQASGGETDYASGFGTTGFNAGAWRLRADWQAQYNRNQSDNESNARKGAKWSRFYAYRALSSLRADLTLGEDYLDSGIFDSFRFVGASLKTDDNMLPPNLRGYAPEITGVAKTNAKVVITQQGRILQEVQVAAGPFNIQSLNSSTNGKLQVRVEEQDGSVQTFEIDTATIPYLTRPGYVRYKLAAGKPTTYESHQTEGDIFTTGEFSWGVNNGWSLYGGAVGSGDYNALALGVGRDLLALGALSFDVTQSRASLPENNNRQQGTYTGGSYRLSYSKRFDQYDSEVTFAGYRFSQQDFMSMRDYLDTRYRDGDIGHDKQLYTITANKHFRELGLSSYLNYSHQSYWNRADTDRYSIALSKYVDLGSVKNASISVNAYRSQYNGNKDDGFYLTLSVPFGNTGYVSLNAQNNGAYNAQYYNRVNDNNSYSVSAGRAPGGKVQTGIYGTHEGDLAQVTGSATYVENSYTSASLSLNGGLTATPEGAALHRINVPGGTRMMLDTDGVAGVPVQGNGGITHTNAFGKAVIADINSYYRSAVNIDLNRLGQNVEATTSVVQATLTDGAVGYRHFDVLSGEKAMAVLRMADGTPPPFGATVQTADKRAAGIVSDGGNVYLSGIKPGESMTVQWDGAVQCHITLPKVLPPQTDSAALIHPCFAQGSKDSPNKNNK